jgi:hypothetical protein
MSPFHGEITIPGYRTDWPRCIDRIQDVFGSNLGRTTGIPDCFSRISSVPLNKFRDNKLIRQQPFPSKPVSVHPTILRCIV